MLRLQLNELPEFITHDPRECQDCCLHRAEGLILRTVQDCHCFVMCKDGNVQNPRVGYVYFINCLASQFCMMTNLT